MTTEQIKKCLRKIRAEHHSAFTSFNTILGLILCRSAIGELSTKEFAQIVYEIQNEK